MINENIGKTFGIYTIKSVHTQRRQDGHLLYLCKCNVCGGIFVRDFAKIKKSQYCKHLNRKWHNRRIGRIYAKMMRRCYDVGDKDFSHYGQKGITICDSWLNNPNLFEEWALENGYQDDLSIDRIDVLQGYNPINCRWITVEENSRRAGKVNWITINQQTLTGRQWAERFGLGPNTINAAIKMHGLDKTEQLLKAMLIDPPCNKHRKSHQTWFDVYNVPL